MDNLHIESALSELYIYTGTATIKYGGLHLNGELCQINENGFSSVDEHIESKLDLYY